MSASQRILPLLAAVALGCVSGAYIFDPILRQYAADTGGTFRPEDLSSTGSASASLKSTSSPSREDRALSQSFTSQGLPVGVPSGGHGSLPLAALPASADSAAGAAQARAQRQRELAVANASARAVEALQTRAQKTADGHVFAALKKE